MILVDTSVLIDFLRGRDNEKCELFNSVIEKRLPFGISNYSFLEVLHGTKTPAAFNTVSEYLESFRFYDLLYWQQSLREVTKLGISCRKNGVTVRSTMVLIIASIAIENKLYLLHNDRDFEQIAKIQPSLSLFNAL